MHDIGGQNSVQQTILSIISTIMGGGIVSIPYAYAVAGFKMGAIIQVAVVISIFISTCLYLRTRRILRCSPSFAMIAEHCMGSVSGIVINSLLVFAIFGILALYIILFSRISISLLAPEDGTGPVSKDSFLAHKTFYVITLCLLIAPIVTRKRI